MDTSSISDQIERIQQSQTFARKAQLRRLLEILYQSMDTPPGLTPEQVIQQLWPAEIRTKRATDVATEMNRLRHALQNYYETEGSNDETLICLPNRGPAAGNGTHERPWIIARPRGSNGGGAAEDHALELPVGVPQAKSGRALKMLGVTAATVVALCIAAYLSYRALAMPDQPRLGRLDGSSLVIMNAEGKELWRKAFSQRFGPDWYFAQGRPPLLWFGDLEGKGHTSVLFSYTPAGQLAHSSTLICYSDRGREKWRWSPGRDLPEMAGSPATFLTLAFGVLKGTKNRSPRIVISSVHSPWWPDQVALLDSNGKVVSEYWHSGMLIDLLLADLNGDGREEIIATGVANGYDHQATLVVLDPDRVSGASTEVRPEFQIHGMGVAQERVRLLFPRSDLNRALYQFNKAVEPIVEHGSLRLTALECTTASPETCPIWYEFDKNFRLIAAYAGGDEFRSAHNRFFQTGTNAHALSADEQAEFLKVRCLAGCKAEFVRVGKLIP